MTHLHTCPSVNARVWKPIAVALATLLATISLESHAASTLLFGDNFNAPDTANFDASDQTGRRSGLHATDIQLRSSMVQHGISGNQLNFLTTGTGPGRIRFQSAAALPSNVWWNFATGAGATQTLADGGLLVEFDWTPADNTSDNWVSFNIGFPDQPAGEPGFRVNHPETDFGILFRNNGGTQYFDNGAATTGSNFDASTVAPRHVALSYSFNSFADGTNVLVSAAVNGQAVLTAQPFLWENNGGALFMELGNLASGTRIDNLSITTIPEPSAGILSLAAGIALTLRRSRLRRER